MVHHLAKFIYHRLMGWGLHGEFPNLKKYVVIVIPHTHWMDFIIGILVRAIAREQINYVGKKSLFKPPFGWFFRATGGAPVDRQKNSNVVDSVVDIYNQREVFRLCLAPEGTRKKVKALKTGFYYIAKKAGVPIVMVAFDFQQKAVTIAEPFYTSEDINSDFRKIRAFFKGVKGKIAENSFGD
ncbi:1-acyl-sn-glycerol-3-phosphate acyltransferase [uncultured Croceitalea sp.]|uniref:1-acyl-sn-glycerol-3-phosphate acyltransferase n=1 Tax=uncultured Croceitalea sp. TaxID=1798908 RepID=UPI0033065D1C